MASTWVKIGDAVGTRNRTTVMPNTASDLRTVTDLFDRIAFSDDGTREVGGLWATDRTLLIAEVTVEIIRFQTVNKRPTVDGVIDRNGGTLKVMNALVSEPPPRKLLTAMQVSPPWADWGHTG